MLDSRSMTSFTSAFEWSKRDTRVDSWALMSSPWPTVVLSCGYLFVALIAGPAFMRNKNPYNLKLVIMTYNIVQVIVSLWLLQGFIANGWGSGYNWVCQPVDTNLEVGSTGFTMAYVIWCAYLVRFLDFFDTFFFIAKKKFTHVNALHVIHHFTTPLYGWLAVRFTPGGQPTFGPMFNALIHAIMYSYYFLAALGPEYQKYLWWKRYLTRLQIIQFIAALLKDVVIVLGLVEDCGFPWQMSLVTVCFMCLMLLLFIPFYIRTYISKLEKKKKT